jgi:hypothetical protein
MSTNSKVMEQLKTLLDMDVVGAVSSSANVERTSSVVDP